MSQILGNALPNIPWQNKPSSCTAPVWRYSQNPVMGRNACKLNRVFNSAVVPYKNEFIGIFRAEGSNGKPFLYLGHSTDAISWKLDEQKIHMVDENGAEWNPLYAYDPRLVQIENEYYIIWCGDFNGAAIGIARTSDFRTFTRLENPFLPFNRNGVLFPRKVNNKYLLLSRPSDSGHTPFGDIFMSQSPDLKYWGEHRAVMQKGGSGWWQSVKIGCGPAPIETDEGWLVFYHGVTGTCNGFVYSMSAAILDINEPSKVLYRAGDFMMTPEEWYEERGFVPNVVFPCAALTDAETGRIAIYYGAADTYLGLAFTTVTETVDFIKAHNEVLPIDSVVGKI